VTSETDVLPGAWNFRDVAEETGVRPGVLRRSSELSELDDDGRTALTGLGVTDVVDLRSARETAGAGRSRVGDAVVVHAMPFFDTSSDVDAAPHEVAMDKLTRYANDDADVPRAVRRVMCEQYAGFAAMTGALRAVVGTISLLAEGRSVLVHCAAGKDRTGFVVAAVLETAGVPYEEITADYLRSQDAVPQLRDRLIRASEADRSRGWSQPAHARARDEMLGVRAEYLQSARRAIDDGYGSLAGYLKTGGVTTESVERLREKLFD
jgi:protein-tyrosine phosphatase